MKFVITDGGVYVRHWRKWYWIVGKHMYPLLISLPEEDEE